MREDSVCVIRFGMHTIEGESLRLVSSRASDARAAYQLSSLAILPGLIPLFIYSTQKTLVDMRLIALEGALLVIADIAVLYFAIKLFKREQILTRWK